MIRRPPRSTLFPYTPLSRSAIRHDLERQGLPAEIVEAALLVLEAEAVRAQRIVEVRGPGARTARYLASKGDRKSTRLNSSHLVISYAVFCLKKKKNISPLML